MCYPQDDAPKEGDGGHGRYGVRTDCARYDDFGLGHAAQARARCPKWHAAAWIVIRRLRDEDYARSHERNTGDGNTHVQHVSSGEHDKQRRR